MSLRLKLAALFFTISQLFLIQHIFAESVHSAQSSFAQPAASHDDAIQKFVRADFAKRRAMLNQWPASIDELDKLVAYVENDELYTDSSGNTYIMKAGDKL